MCIRDRSLLELFVKLKHAAIKEQNGLESVVDFLQTTKFLEHLLTPAIYRPIQSLSPSRNVTVFGSIGVGKSTTLNALMNQVVLKYKCDPKGFFKA